MTKFILLLWCAYLISNVSCAQSEHNTNYANAKPISIKIDQVTYLYCSKAMEMIGDWKMQPGENVRWNGNSKIKWFIEVQREDSFNLFINAWVPESSKGNEIKFNVGKEKVNFQLQPTKGLEIGGRNFQRIQCTPRIHLEKGINVVTLASDNVDDSLHVMDLRAIELEPISALQRIENNIQKAVNSRANSAWLAKAGYGVMFHWTSQSVNPDGTNLPYEEAVNRFDVEKFAQMVGDTGAGYVIFTIGHAEPYCPAPIAHWEKHHPGMTTKRDLIWELAEALSKKNIRLICYMPTHVVAKYKKVDETDFMKINTEILREMGDRYKEKIAGYWFDGWYQCFEEYPNVSFEEFFNATKTGNKDRIIALNSWIYPEVTPWQEYWAGEVASPVTPPIDGHMKNGPVPDLRYQALLIMEPYWVQQKAIKPDPRFDANELSQYIRNCMNNGGAVTVNIGIFQDGTIGEKALNVMKQVRGQIRGKE